VGIHIGRTGGSALGGNHSSRKLMRHSKKRNKRRSNNILAYSPEDHGDHPQSVLLPFAQ